MKKKVLAEKAGLDYSEIENILSLETLQMLAKGHEKEIFGGGGGTASLSKDICEYVQSSCSVPLDSFCGGGY